MNWWFKLNSKLANLMGIALMVFILSSPILLVVMVAIWIALRVTAQ